VGVASTIEVIADSSRRHILDELRSGEMPVNVLVGRLAMSQPAVSKHLRVLREAGLVTVRPDGQRRLYSVRPQPFIELDTWLEPYRQMWRDSLDKLEAQLAGPQPAPAGPEPAPAEPEPAPAGPQPAPGGSTDE
jgi:DNA-binding transcriptional ArsR family regulator